MYNVGRGKPQSPQELAQTDQRAKRDSLVPVLTIVGFVVGTVLVVFSCAGVPGLFALLAIGSVGAFIGLQYLVWGWWLGNRIRREEQAARDQAQDE